MCSYRGKLGPIPFPTRSSARLAQIMGYPLSCGASRAACSPGTQAPSPFRSSRLHPSLLCPRSSQRSHAANPGPLGHSLQPRAWPLPPPHPCGCVSDCLWIWLPPPASLCLHPDGAPAAGRQRGGAKVSLSAHSAAGRRESHQLELHRRLGLPPARGNRCCSSSPDPSNQVGVPGRRWCH